MVEDVEEYILRTAAACKLLNIVDNKNVYHLIEANKVVQLSVLECGLELGHKLIGRYIEYLQLRVTLTHFVADSLYDVGLSQSRRSIYIEWVER